MNRGDEELLTVFLPELSTMTFRWGASAFFVRSLVL